MCADGAAPCVGCAARDARLKQVARNLAAVARLLPDSGPVDAEYVRALLAAPELLARQEVSHG